MAKPCALRHTPAAALDDLSAPPPPVVTPPRGSAIALGLALLVAWALALVDGLVLVSGTELAAAPVLGVLLGLWTLVGLLAGLLGHALATYRARHAPASGDTHPREASGDTHSREASGDTHPRAPWELALSTSLLLWAGLAVHRVLIAFEDRSTDTLLVATVALLLLGTPTALAIRRGARRRIARHLAGGSRFRTCLVCASLVIPALLGLLGSLWAHHADFFTELATHEPWGDALALLLPVTLGLLAAAHAGRLGWVSRQLGLVARPRRSLVVALALSLLGLLMGVLGAQGLEPANARALRDRSLYSGSLVRAALQVGVPAAALDTVVGLRACTPGVALAAPGSLGSVASDAPDILLITIDGLRFDHTSLAPDSQHANTPRLLAHASRAAVFTRAYTPAPSTRAAFRSIFTGLLPGQQEAPPEPRFPWAMTLAPTQPTLAAYLQQAGYHTIALVSKPKAFPVSTHALAGFSEIDDTPTAYQTRHEHSAQLKVSRIIGHLAEPPGDRPPRFVWTHFIEPHFPFTRGATDDPSPRGGRSEARHDSSVRFVDEQLERLLRFVQSPERRDRTIVIITSDHGEAFGEHHNSRHGATVYEEEIHVPLLVFGPGIIAGTHATPVSLVELLPTILDLAGLSPATGVCGTGWAAALRSGAEPTPQPVYVAALPDGTTRYHQLAFLLGDEKLIVDGGTGEPQRFQLASDPHEQRPDEGSARVASLRTALDAFLRERGLPTPP